MERFLLSRKVLPYRSVAASAGGAEDRAAGLSEEGLSVLQRAMKRSKLRLIEPETYAESVVERMAIYREHAAGRPRATPPPAALIDSVMARFLDEGVPVIHFLQINRMAQRYGLPVSPQVRPVVGSGQVFLQRRYNPWLAVGALSAVVGSLFLFIRSGRGRMALQSARREGGPLEPSL
jgi:hypothetical protein